MVEERTENLELELLLDAIYKRWGYDFRSYAHASILRRTKQFLMESGCSSISEIIPKVIHDRECFSQLAQRYSIPVTEMFRDPQVYLALRERVIPMLKTWPHFKIWHAGCATGEEVYSLAILLWEAGIYERATIYATDFNDAVLDHAKEGVYEVERMKEATRNYQLAGGRESFANYFHVRYNAAVIDPKLKERIVFSGHNLACEGSFGEMHVVFCRNVLIYFNRDLQNRALNLFTESLVFGGFLCLGTKETLRFSDVHDQYESVDKKLRIFKNTGAACDS